MLYTGRGDYLEQLRRAAEELAGRGLLFEEDIGLVLEQGGAMYDFVRASGAWMPDKNWGITEQ
jgi:hypothetical protein